MISQRTDTVDILRVVAKPSNLLINYSAILKIITKISHLDVILKVVENHFFARDSCEIIKPLTQSKKDFIESLKVEIYPTRRSQDS